MHIITPAEKTPNPAQHLEDQQGRVKIVAPLTKRSMRFPRLENGLTFFSQSVFGNFARKAVCPVTPVPPNSGCQILEGSNPPP